jgi:isopenicillin-N N-acyltransferase like protein
MELYQFLMYKKIIALKAAIFRILIFASLLSVASQLISGCKVYRAYDTVFSKKWDKDKTIPEGMPRIEYHHSIPVIHLYGTPYEMGSQYGILLENQLEGLLMIVNRFFPEKVINKYMEFAGEVEKMLPPESLAFISGMAETSGADYKKILTLNTVPKTTCSTLAVWGDATHDGNLLMGRNADYIFKKINKGLGIIVVKHPSVGYATISSSFLGMAGAFTGMNEKGVCYGNMLVYNGFEDKNKTDGLPIQILMQNAAEKSDSAEEMIDLLTKEDHLTPINVMCADSCEAIVAELGQDNFACRKGEKGILAASNYFYSEKMYKNFDNDPRYSLLMIKARDNYGMFNLDHLQEAMHDARKPNQNLQCVLFDPARKIMYVSMNKVPASRGPFFSFDLIKLIKR